MSCHDRHVCYAVRIREDQEWIPVVCHFYLSYWWIKLYHNLYDSKYCSRGIREACVYVCCGGGCLDGDCHEICIWLEDRCITCSMSALYTPPTTMKNAYICYGKSCFWCWPGPTAKSNSGSNKYILYILFLSEKAVMVSAWEGLICTRHPF